MQSAHLLQAKRHVPSLGGPCFCCRLRDDGIGRFISDGWESNVVWSCDQHLPLLRAATSMKGREWVALEGEAIEAAGRAAGGYLDKLGRFDLASLEKWEWLDFLRTLIVAFGNDLAKRLEERAPADFRSMRGAARDLDEFELAALTQAGQRGGAYLDEIDKTDLGALERGEWIKFCDLTIMAFGKALQRELEQNEAPF